MIRMMDVKEEAQQRLNVDGALKLKELRYRMKKHPVTCCVSFGISNYELV